MRNFNLLLCACSFYAISCNTFYPASAQDERSQAQETIEAFYQVYAHKAGPYEARFFTEEAKVVLPKYYSSLSVPAHEWLSLFQKAHAYLPDYQCLILGIYPESVVEGRCTFKVNVLHQHGKNQWQCVDRISLEQKNNLWKISSIEFDVDREGIEI